MVWLLPLVSNRYVPGRLPPLWGGACGRFVCPAPPVWGSVFYKDMYGMVAAAC